MARHLVIRHVVIGHVVALHLAMVAMAALMGHRRVHAGLPRLHAAVEDVVIQRVVAQGEEEGAGAFPDFLGRAARVVAGIFPKFIEDPALMPLEWTRAAEDKGDDEAGRARVVCDYIAGMTDRYASAQYRLLFDGSAELR